MATVAAPAHRHRRSLAGFWDGPLGYPQAALVVATAIAIGLFFHARIGYRVAVSAEWACAAGFGGAAAVALATLRYRNSAVVRWLTGIPFAICSVAGVGLLAGLGAALPSRFVETRLGVPSIYASWPFWMSLAVMETNLVGTTARRCWPLSRASVSFTLSHLGLALAILGGLVSATTLERVTLLCPSGQTINTGRTADGRIVRLPFAVTLRDFHLETFPPTLALVTRDPRNPNGITVTPGAKFTRAGMGEQIGDVTVSVQRYSPHVAEVGGVWREVPFRTCAPAAYVAVQDGRGRRAGAGWVSYGSVDTPASSVEIGRSRAIVMPRPRPREYRSTVSMTTERRTETRTIRVNQPVSIGGYRLYQLSYDERMGDASEYSVLEAVRDRGVPLVYTGLLMVLGGAMAMLWHGVGDRERQP